MARRVFAAGSVSNSTGAPLRLSFYTTQTGTLPESDLWTVDGSFYPSVPIPNGTVLTTAAGAYSSFAGPDDIDSLWIAPSNGAARTQITATRAVASAPTSDTTPAALASDSAFTSVYGKLWTSPAASTTLTGTLAAWVITAVDCTAGAGARTLPAASSVTAGTAFCAKKADTSANNLVVSRAGSDLIYGTGSGSTSKTLSLAGEAVEFVSDGVNKWTVRSSDTPSSVLARTYVERTYEGSNLFVYGHSFAMVPGAYCTPNGGEWASRVANRLSMTALVRGVSGSKMGDVAQGAIGSTWPGSNGTKTLAAASQGLVILEAECNDYMFEANVADATYQLGFKHSLRAFFAAASAGSRVDSTTATATGTWSTLSGSTSGFSGGSIKYTQTQNDHIDWSSVSAPTGYVYLLTLANDSGNGTGTLAIAVDGTDQGVSYTGQGQMKQYTSGCGGGTIAFVPAVIKVTVPASGTHTITVTKTDASGASKSVYVDSLLIPSTTPPPILVLKDPQTNSTAAATVGGTLAAAYTTYSPTYHGLIDTVVAEFTNAYTLDLTTGWTPSTMQSSLDASFRFHPNDLGMAQIADSVQAWIKANLTQYATGLTTA